MPIRNKQRAETTMDARLHVPALEEKTVRVVVGCDVELRHLHGRQPALDDGLRLFGGVRDGRLGPDGEDRVEVSDPRLALVVPVDVVVNHLPQEVFGVGEPVALGDRVDEIGIRDVVGLDAFVAVFVQLLHLAEEGFGALRGVGTPGVAPAVEYGGVGEAVWLAPREQMGFGQRVHRLQDFLAPDRPVDALGLLPRVEKRRVVPNVRDGPVLSAVVRVEHDVEDLLDLVGVADPRVAWRYWKRERVVERNGAEREIRAGRDDAAQENRA